MKSILLSGGSGQRLWPLSNGARSKQFLKVLRNPEGFPESMVQRIWRQLGEAGLASDAVIAAGKSQIEMLQHQLGSSVPVVPEPDRRDTFPAIALACSYLYSEKRVDSDEPVVVLPVDHYVDTAYFQQAAGLGGVLNDSGAEIVLMGARPTYPSAKYGYIVPASHDSDRAFHWVSHFREKPSEAEAASLIKERALWNCGVLVFRLGFMIDLLQKRNWPNDYRSLAGMYRDLPATSFDYEVLERTRQLAVVPYEGSWKDIGTWMTLTEEMESNQVGKSWMSEDSTGTHVVNELDIPVAVLGVANAVVAVSPDGILVADKQASSRMKEMVRFDRRPMYEERRWGWYRVLDYVKYEQGVEVLTKRVCIQAGKNLSYQRHNKRNETWTVIRGEGKCFMDGTLQAMRPGTVIHIPVGTDHAVKAVTDMEFIEVQMGSELVEEDVERMELNWLWD